MPPKGNAGSDLTPSFIKQDPAASLFRAIY
jgi:hypothetical protein